MVSGLVAFSNHLGMEVVNTTSEYGGTRLFRSVTRNQATGALLDRLAS